MNSSAAVLISDIFRVLTVLFGGYLVGQCVYRGGQTDSPAVRSRIIGLGILGGGLAFGTCFRFGDSFNPGLPIILVGLLWSVHGMNLLSPGDQPDPDEDPDEF